MSASEKTLPGWYALRDSGRLFIYAEKREDGRVFGKLQHGTGPMSWVCTEEDLLPLTDVEKYSISIGKYFIFSKGF